MSDVEKSKAIGKAIVAGASTFSDDPNEVIDGLVIGLCVLRRECKPGISREELIKIITFYDEQLDISFASDDERPE